MVDGKKHVEAVPADWIDAVRPSVEVNREKAMAQRCLSRTEPVEPPLRPRLAEQPSRFVLLEREVELEYKPQMLAALQRKFDTAAEEAHTKVPGRSPQSG